MRSRLDFLPACQIDRVYIVKRAMKHVAHVSAVSLLFLLVLCGCGKKEPAVQTPGTTEKVVKQKTIEEVLAERTPEWMAIPGVVGTGIGKCDGKPCITVLAAKATDSLRQRIPKEVEGYPVRLEVSGEIRAH